MADVDMHSRIRVAMVLGWCLAAASCAQTQASRSGGAAPRGAPAQAERRVKLAVLPVESDLYPRVAGTINGLFRDIQVQGIDDYFMSKVTLEVVQLSIECVESSSACYTAVGRSLASNRLLLAQVTPLNVAAMGKTRRRDKEKDRETSLRVTVTYFNVDDQTACNVVDRTFKTEDAAADGLAELVQKAVQPTSVAAQRPR